VGQPNADASGVTLHITFQSPPSLQDRSEEHERRFRQVPPSTAQKIKRDFATYAQTGRDALQQRMYWYCRRPDGTTQIMLPLDFEEVISISVTRPS